jgi:hypothetical protein
VFDLEEAWLRGEGEALWVPLGAWKRGDPLPSPAVGPAGDPPGWLVAGLPQGRSALVGGGGRRWLRWVDLAGPP